MNILYFYTLYVVVSYCVTVACVGCCAVASGFILFVTRSLYLPRITLKSLHTNMPSLSTEPTLGHVWTNSWYSPASFDIKTVGTEVMLYFLTSSFPSALEISTYFSLCNFN